LLATFITLFSIASPGEIVGTNTPAEGLSAERISRLPKAEQRAWRKYLKRSQAQRRGDQDFFRREMKQHGLRQSTLPPEQRGVRGISLDRPKEWYGSAEALRLADNIVSFQTPAGGWTKNIDMTTHARAPGERFAHENLSHYPGRLDFDVPQDANWNYVGTFDNDATTTQLEFLARVITASVKVQSVQLEGHRPPHLGPLPKEREHESAALEGSVTNALPLPGGEGRGEGERSFINLEAKTRLRKAFFKGLDYIFAAQYPNGGWPQVWPLQGGYHDAITYNDGAMTHVLALLKMVASGAGDYGFVPATIRARARVSMERGIQCVLATQIHVGGRRTVWCQQHDVLTLTPCSARNYEMPCQVSAESAEIVLLLMDLPKPSAGVVPAVDQAVEWFEKTRIQDVQYRRGDPDGRDLVAAAGHGPLWARYYEIGTDRPIFGDRDQTIHDRLEEISAERRRGYGWYRDTPRKTIARHGVWRTKELNELNKLNELHGLNARNAFLRTDAGTICGVEGAELSWLSFRSSLNCRHWRDIFDVLR